MSNFNEQEYLKVNRDVAAAVARGEFESGWSHYELYGKTEGRLTSLEEYNAKFRWQTKRSTIARHSNIWSWLSERANRPDVSVLEIGSRSVASDCSWKTYVPECDYTGFDVMQGRNVDVVGDAHRLSEYFQDKKFDFILSFAVFEHIALPWLVSEEISKLLKDGGITAHETTFSYSEHELPWHFFQFNNNTLENLFCPEMGFELIDSGLDNPIDGVFAHDADEYLAGTHVPDLYCHSAIIAKMNRASARETFSWVDVSDRISKSTMYPEKSGRYGHKQE
ncbi:MAG: class I SAM-dependent methyltransferase [Pseudomonadota bacterium]